MRHNIIWSLSISIHSDERERVTREKIKYHFAQLFNLFLPFSVSFLYSHISHLCIGSVKIPLQITTKSKQGTKSYITMSSYGNMKHNSNNHNPSGVTYEETEMMTNGDNNYSITTTTTTATPTTNQQFKTKFNAKKTSISSSWPSHKSHHHYNSDDFL